MPVNRKRVEINTSVSRGVMSAPQVNDPTLEQATRMFSDRASYYARMMARTSEREARALAKRAVFSEGPDGTPQMTDDPTKRMGRIARETYDGAIEERFAQQLTTSMRAQIAEAEAMHGYDYDAFAGEAVRRIERMRDDVPEEYAGAFQQISTGLLVDSGISVTMRQARMADEQDGQLYDRQARTQVSQIEEAILAGNDEAARMILNDTEWLDSIPDHVMGPAQKAEWTDRMVYTAGVTRMMRDLEVREIDDRRELVELSERLLAGDDPEVMEYFTEKDGTVRYDLAERAANFVSRFSSGVASREGAAQDRLDMVRQDAERAARLDGVLNGVSTGTKEDKAVLDAYLSTEADLTTEDGAPRSIHWSDWFKMDEDTRARLLPAVKQSGVIPPSLEQAFRRMERVNDPAEMVGAFGVYLDLKNSPNQNGQVIDWTGVLDERTSAVFRFAEDMHNQGGSFQSSVEDAFGRVNGLYDSDWNPLKPGKNDDEFLYRAMSDAGAGDETMWFGSDLTSDNARTRMRRAVNSEVFEDIDALPGEKNEAHRIMETYLASGERWQDAMELTSQHMEGRYSESAYMNVPRSAHAPERHYATPAPGGIMELLRRQGRKGAGALAGLAEFGVESTILGPFVTMRDQMPDWLRADFGSDRLRAEPFGVMADTKIREMLADDPMAEEVFGGNVSGFLTPGEDYKLIANAEHGSPPTYTVMMRNNASVFAPVGTLDLREEWQEFTETDNTVREARKLRRRSASRDAMTWEEVWKALDAGQSPEYRKMIERLVDE